MNVNVHSILKVKNSFGVEHHWLPTCPCEACATRRGKVDITLTNPLRSITVEAAFLFGYITSRSPHGSLARQLASSQNGV